MNVKKKNMTCFVVQLCFSSTPRPKMQYIVVTLVGDVCGVCIRNAGVHGSRDVRGEVRRGGGCLCVWHVYLGDDHVRIPVLGVPKRCADLPQSHQRECYITVINNSIIVLMLLFSKDAFNWSTVHLSIIIYLKIKIIIKIIINTYFLNIFILASCLGNFYFHFIIEKKKKFKKMYIQYINIFYYKNDELRWKWEIWKQK